MKSANRSRTPTIRCPLGFRLGYFISIVLFVSFSAFAYGSTSTTSRLETPQGPIDGKNTNFTLSHPPVNSEVVKLFLNQIELAQGTQYRVNGQIIDFMFPTIPKVGDSLFVMYQVRTVDSSTAPETRDVVISQERTQSLVRSALSEVVLAESLPTPASSGKINSVGAPSQEIRMKQQGTLGSIRSLEQRLDDRRITDSATQQRGSQPLVGLDGAGDSPITSPYSVLLGAHPTDAGAVLGTGQGTVGNPTDLTTPRSILLLERRFNSLTPTDAEANKPTVER